MSLILSGKTALVTGASRGIGRAIAERLAADGAAVIVNYARTEKLAQEVVKAIEAKGGKAIAIQADVAKPAEVQRLFSAAEKAMGKLDIVVANAGVHAVKPLIENTEADYNYIFDINTRGFFSPCRRPAGECVTAAASSSCPPAARRCILPTCRFISAAKAPSSSSLARCPSSSARAMLRLTFFRRDSPTRTCCPKSTALTARACRRSIASAPRRKSRMSPRF